MWLLILLILFVIAGDLAIVMFSGMEFQSWMKALLYAVSFFVLLALMHAFPLLARFENSIWNTLKNSMFMGIMTLPKTVLMIVCWIIPVALAVIVPYAIPIAFCFGLSGPGLMCAALYNKTFKKFEPNVEQPVSDEEWTVAACDVESDQ